MQRLDKRLRDNAAALAMAVGDGVKTSSGYSGSAAFPCNAASYMRKSGYSMATRRWGLNKEMILEMLDNLVLLSYALLLVFQGGMLGW